jgi:hypothetical protein
MIPLINGEIRERSTEAARDFVLATRDRLHAEVAREGDEAASHRSFQRLQHAISDDELLRTWPHADLTIVLAD